jgi:oligopeptidase B
MYHHLLAILAACLPALLQPQAPRPERIPHTREIHGRTLEDPYFWLRERDNPKVLEHLKSENGCAAAVMAGTESLQKALYDEMLARIKQTDLSVPYRKNGWWYYSRTEEGKSYPIHCRRQGSIETPEEITLDVNELADGKPFLIARPIAVSPDTKILAYGVDLTGGRRLTIYFKHLTTGELLPDRLENCSGSLAWYADSRAVIYTTLDHAVRSDKAFRHRLGTDPASDALVHHETDEKFGLGVRKTLSERFILLTMGSMKTSEARFAPADDPGAPFAVIEPRREGVEYEVDHHGDRFLINHNDGALNFTLVEAPVAAPGRANWKTLIPHRDDVLLQGTIAFKNHLVVRTRQRGLPVLQVRRFDTADAHAIDFPESSYALFPSINPEFETPMLRFDYTSLITPNSVFEYDMNTRQSRLLKEQPVLGGYDRSNYVTERLYARAPDAAEVPIALVYRKGLKRDGSAPALLNGYGSYGANTDASFSSNIISLLDRGFVYARAQIRGGSEKGRAWYEAGRLMNKRNTFTDFIAAAEMLVQQGYTSPARLAIRGGSAGGLLMGAVTNMRPDLFRVVVADVPFVDVINTMLDDDLPLTVIEYDQWGNPHDKAAFEYIFSYSPYDNIAPRAYPSILATVGLNDSNVPYWEGTKWVAKLRDVTTSGNPVLLKANLDAGHGGASGRYQALEEEAFRYAFMLSQMGIGR